METRDTGIILSFVPYKDDDNIVEVFLENNKVMSVYAPGTRKMESKNRQSLIIGNIVDVEYFKARIDGKMSRLKKFESSDIYIPKDEKTYKTIKKITKLLSEYKFTKRSKNTFENFERFISELKNKNDGSNEYLLIAGNVVSDSSTNFSFTNCAICGKRKEVKSFSLREGGIICTDCAGDKYPVFTKDMLVYFFFLLRNDYENLKTVNINWEQKMIIARTINEYFTEILGLYTKI